MATPLEIMGSPVMTPAIRHKLISDIAHEADACGWDAVDVTTYVSACLQVEDGADLTAVDVPEDPDVARSPAQHVAELIAFFYGTN